VKGGGPPRRLAAVGMGHLYLVDNAGEPSPADGAGSSPTWRRRTPTSAAGWPWSSTNCRRSAGAVSTPPVAATRPRGRAPTADARSTVSIPDPSAPSLRPAPSSSNTTGQFARDEDGDGFCEVHVNTPEGLWSLLRSWLRPHRGISQERLPLYLGSFEFVHNVRRRGKALLESLIGLLVAPRNPG
jgi:hypothetical protein